MALVWRGSAPPYVTTYNAHTSSHTQVPHVRFRPTPIAQPTQPACHGTHLRNAHDDTRHVDDGLAQYRAAGTALAVPVVLGGATQLVAAVRRLHRPRGAECLPQQPPRDGHPHGRQRRLQDLRHQAVACACGVSAGRRACVHASAASQHHARRVARDGADAADGAGGGGFAPSGEGPGDEVALGGVEDEEAQRVDAEDGAEASRRGDGDGLERGVRHDLGHPIVEDA